MGEIAHGQTISTAITGPAATSNGQLLVITGNGSVQSPTSASGKAIIADATSPSITNNGLIQNGAASGIGLHVTSGGSVAMVTNTGTVSASATGGRAIVVGNTSSIGTLINAAGATIIGTGTNAQAIDVVGFVDTIVNSGTIQGSTDSSTGAAALQIDATGTVGSIINNAGGTIAGSSYSAIGVLGNLETLSNNGLIAAAAGGTSNDGIYVTASGSVGSIINGATGTIAANTPNGWAIEVDGSVGSLINSGLIQSATTGGDSIGTNVAGGTISTLDNLSGETITAANIAIAVSGTIGSVYNSGMILAPGGTAIEVLAGGTIPGGITNSAGGLIQGLTAIDNSANATPLVINNAGSIVGAINCGTSADQLNITGIGTVAGDITGTTGSGASINFAPASPYTLANTITNVDAINLLSGTLGINQGAGTRPIAGALAVTASPGATVNFISGTVQAVAFNNNGLLNIGTGTPTINGAYTQSGTGRFAVAVAGSGSGLLTVTGTAAIAGPIQVSVPPISASSLHLIGETIPILNSAGLTVSNPSVLTATYNYSGGSPWIEFAVDQTPTGIELTGVVPLVTHPIQASCYDLGSCNVSHIQTALTGLLDHLATDGDAIDYSLIVNALANKPNAQQQEILRRLEPSLLANATALLGGVLDLDNTTESSISNRLAAARSESGLAESGLAAGDTVGRGYQVWIQPFGSFTTLDSSNGVDGFSANTSGAALGADTLVRPDLRVGIALGLGNTNIDYNGNLSGNNASIFTTQLALYGT